MKFLSISDASSMHTYNYMKYILATTNYDITIFSISNKAIPEEYKSFYKERNITVVHALDADSPLATSTKLLKRITKFFIKISVLKKLGKHDICQLMYINPSGSLLLRLCRKNYRFILLTYWGSDILQINTRLIFFQKLILKYADAITLCTGKMFRKFKEVYGNKYDSKLHKVNVIVGTLENIKRIHEEVGVCQSKAYYQLPQDKKCVMCGYNGASAQQQDTIVAMLSSLEEQYKKDIHIIMPFMYGCADFKYITKVKKLLENSGISYTIIERYLSYDEMAKLSLATDIYLQLRFTDALSASMQEQIYAGSVVIRGSWLEYDELENTELPIYKIDSMDELNRTIISVLDNFENIHHEILPAYIHEMSSGKQSQEQSFRIYGNLE